MYKEPEDRIIDSQYEDRLRHILEKGVLVKDTPQGVGAITCFGELPPMVFEVSNGAPLITTRKISFWRKPIGEIFAFVNGVRTIEGLRSFGCDLWDDYEKKGPKFGLPEGDLGPAYYGGAFHDFPMPDGGSFNQFAHIVEQLKKFPFSRTTLVTPWIPFWIGRGGFQKAVVSPCHGWLHFRVFEDRLSMIMNQRSADFPIGVPSNMIQYFALLLAIGKVVGLKPWKFIHSFGDAHIYENQADAVRELLARKPKVFPKLHLSEGVEDLFEIRADHFELSQYDPHPGIKIPYLP